MRISLALALLAFSAAAHAQVPAEVTIQWTNPTQDVEGNPLTGARALTKIQVWVSDSSIPESTTAPPTAEVGPEASSTVQPVSVPVGGTVHARLKACNLGGCSVFTPEATGVVTVPTPDVPSDVTIRINLTP